MSTTRNIRAWLMAAIALLWALAPAAALASAPTADLAGQESLRRDFLKSHCHACHSDGGDEIGGGVRLDTLADDISSDVATADLWQKVLRAVNSGEMPPAEKPRPDAEKLETFLESLSHGLVAARRKLAGAGAGITLRRLNRREYARTIRDLVGTEADVSNLPNDAVGGGYDTAGTSLVISSDQFEAYLAIARQALRERLARGGSLATTSDVMRLTLDRSSTDLVKALKTGEQTHDRGLTSLGDAGTRDTNDYPFINQGWAWFIRYGYYHVLPSTIDGLRQPRSDELAYLSIRGARPMEKIQVPKDWPPGRYVVRIQCAAVPDAPRSRRFLEVVQPVAELTILGCDEVLGTPDQPQAIEQEVMITSTGSRDIGIRERHPTVHENVQAHYYASLNATGKGLTPVVGIDAIEVEGPLPDRNPGVPILQSLFSSHQAAADESALRHDLEAFATRAFRGRQPSRSFIDKLVAIRRMQLDQGATPNDAMAETIAVILASPAFLYLVEPGSDSGSRRLSNQELASRLSYFLTGGPPNDELLAAAAAGELVSTDALVRHADRLIASDLCEEFVKGFAYQWLDLERLEFFRFDPVRFWDFDDSTREAARQEIYRFFTRVLRENLPAREFLDSNWTVANGLLGSYYGLDGVHGPEWRVVSLPERSHRGGLMGMAGVLAMGSNGIRTSPVERGTWVLRKLIDRPPPPAPANVPQLSRLDGKPLNARERLKTHQESPQCIHCHKKIDPIGFGMENFDAAGRWRTEETLTVKGAGDVTWPIDASGTFIDGRPFVSYEELKTLVASCEPAFARSLAANLLEYALGRPLGMADDEILDAIESATKSQGHRLGDIVHAVIRSEAFRSK